VFDPELAARLKAIYSAGDTREPMALYLAFRGRPPRIEPLLEQRGLNNAA
jgi:peptidyl-dipeptidase Dcp